MVCSKIYLKEYFSFLGDGGRNPSVYAFLPYNMHEMNRQDRKRPCVVICPGGGYEYCSEREMEPIALKFTSKGYNAFVLDYSVMPHSFPVQLCEVAALMELICKNQDAWNCDTDRIVIIGFSAGGHLAAHYSNMYDCSEVREYFPESKPVSAAVLSYPVITADDKYWHRGSISNVSGIHGGAAEEYDRFSCERLVSEKTPPTFIWHTAPDDCVPVMNSLLYAEALSKSRVPYEMHIYPFGGHGLATADEQTNDSVPKKIQHVRWLADMFEWLDLIGENK